MYPCLWQAGTSWLSLWLCGADEVFGIMFFISAWSYFSPGASFGLFAVMKTTLAVGATSVAPSSYVRNRNGLMRDEAPRWSTADPVQCWEQGDSDQLQRTQEGAHTSHRPPFTHTSENIGHRDPFT